MRLFVCDVRKIRISILTRENHSWTPRRFGAIVIRQVLYFD
jgi:hypothetical protein